jgi:hypothetical protein
MSDTTTISRRQLYEDIWSTPLGELSRKYGISNEAIARACKRHSVPRPSQGYWSKKRAGWADPPPPLLPADDPRLDTVTLAEEHPEDVPDIVGPLRHAVDDEVNRRIEEELAGPPIIVPDRVRSPHRFVAASIEEHAQRMADERRRKSNPTSYHSREIEPRVRANVSAHSKETRERAYRIMDTLFTALEERGYEVGGTPEKFGGTTLVTVLGVKFDVRLHEPCRRQVHLLTPDEQRKKEQNGYSYAPSHDKIPTGRLCLEFRTEGGWMVLAHRQDGERVRLENSLKDLIVAVLRKVDLERQAEREREQKRAVQREAEAQQRCEEERRKQMALEQQQEEARLEALLAEVKRWRDSQEIRAYLEEVRRVIAARGQVIPPGGKLERWMHWAGAMADRLDPLRPSDPPAPTRPADGLSVTLR